jgi:hypothetical protein
VVVGRYDGGSHGSVMPAEVSTYLPCWHHICFVWDGSASAIYRDGMLQSMQDPVLGSPADDDFAFSFVADEVYLVGNSGTPTDNIAHLAVYPTALSASDVAANYAAAVPRQDGACFAVTYPPRHQAYVIS